MNARNRFFRALSVVALLASGPAFADFNDGVVAHAMGDYDRAVQTMLPLAETSDHAYAQYFMGVMYANGQGVERDFSTAADWFRKSAEQGVAAAQTKLGSLYEKGAGVPKDMEFAFAWYSVASKMGNGRAISALENARQKMSAEELSEAEKLAKQYIEAYGTPPETKPTGPIKR